MSLYFDPKDFFQTEFHFAVVGASNNKKEPGFDIYMFLKDEWQKVTPVNAEEKVLQGDPCFPNLTKMAKKKRFPDVVIYTALKQKDPYLGLAVLKEMRDLGIFRIWCEIKCDTFEMREFARKNNIQLMTNLFLQKEIIPFLPPKKEADT